MAFRGFGDDAMKVAADQRQHEAQMAQIAASERASRRSAAVAMAGQAEGAREFDERQGLAREQMAQEERQAGLNREAVAGERAAARDFEAREAGLNREQSAAIAGAELGLKARQQQFGEQMSAAELAQKERQLQLNEATYARLQQQYEQEQAMQTERTNQENAATLAAMRAAGEGDGPVHPLFLNAINAARGVAYGDPGSITGLFPITDDKGARYGFGVTEIDKDGNEIQKSKDPAEVFPKMAAMMKPEAWAEFSGRLIAGNKTAFDDKVKLAVMQTQAQMDRARVTADAKADAAEQANAPKLPDLMKAQAALAKAMTGAGTKTEQDALKKQLEDVNAGIAKLTSRAAGKEPQAFDAGKASKGGKSAVLNAGMIVLKDEATGREMTVEDTPAARDAIKKAYGITF